ncbi:MAG: tRNA preQ1(34) S-adenosylmethionine ribosyltransferase-isomerase QueA [Chloroflexota bacterium]
MQLSEFDYHLPQHLIAQTPIEPRHAARLMIIDRQRGHIEHKYVSDLPHYLQAGDIMVANDSRVMPARLFGTKATGGKMELLLLKQVDALRWEALAGGKRLREGVVFKLNDTAIKGNVEAVLDGPKRLVQFEQPINDLLPEIGHMPLPPYIHESLTDSERYQTVYSKHEGSAAAPTAGLHFSPDLLLTLREQGILLDYVTLHVGLDTFKPVEVEEITNHAIHQEWASLSTETAKRINESKLAKKHLLAIGTTSVRTLETAALRSAGITGSLREASQLDPNLCPWKPVAAFTAPTDLFIYPGFTFRATDYLLTNFHLPKSSLLMLVGAFMGLELLHDAYQIAIEEEYRFFSFGDAMLIL